MIITAEQAQLIADVKREAIHNKTREKLLEAGERVMQQIQAQAANGGTYITTQENFDHSFFNALGYTIEEIRIAYNQKAHRIYWKTKFPNIDND